MSAIDSLRTVVARAVIDTHTGRQIGRSYGPSAPEARAAHRKADGLDLAYGAVRYTVRLTFR